jgi:hypothetical protein
MGMGHIGKLGELRYQARGGQPETVGSAPKILSRRTVAEDRVTELEASKVDVSYADHMNKITVTRSQRKDHSIVGYGSASGGRRPERCRAMVITQARTRSAIAELMARRVPRVDFLRRTVRVEFQTTQHGEQRVPPRYQDHDAPCRCSIWSARLWPNTAQSSRKSRTAHSPHGQRQPVLAALRRRASWLRPSATQAFRPAPRVTHWLTGDSRSKILGTSPTRPRHADHHHIRPVPPLL